MEAALGRLLRAAAGSCSAVISPRFATASSASHAACDVLPALGTMSAGVPARASPLNHTVRKGASSSCPATTSSTAPLKDALRSVPVEPRNAAHPLTKPWPSGLSSCSFSHALRTSASRTFAGECTSTQTAAVAAAPGTSIFVGADGSSGMPSTVAPADGGPWAPRRRRPRPKLPVRCAAAAEDEGAHARAHHECADERDAHGGPGAGAPGPGGRRRAQRVSVMTSTP